MSKSLKKLIDINRLREFKNKLVGAGSAYVQTTAVDQTIAGTKTFSKPIVGSVTGSSGSCTGNAATATKATQDSDGNQINTTYSKVGHTHDDRYYTEAEVDNLLAGKANSSHTHPYIPTSASCNKNWYWSGQGGQPTWIWGGEDGTNMYVYNPSNFSVNYANSAGYANWLRTSSHSDYLFHIEWDGSYFWTYVTAGDGGYRPVRVARSDSAVQDAAGNTITTTYATKSELASKANDSDVVHKSGDETIAGTKTFSSNIVGNVTGNASTATTATKLAAARTIALSGAATGTATAFDGSGNITIPVTALAASSIRAQWYAAYPDGAEAHNAMWGGRNITAAFNNGTVSTNIANGTFKDIFPGDYITKQVTIPRVLADDGTTELFAGGTYNVNWVIADCDYWINKGDQNNSMETHHVVIVPQAQIFYARMNSTNTTEGGYAGSEMYKNIIPACATGIVNAFGSDHILTFRDAITNSVDTTHVSSGLPQLTGTSDLWNIIESVQCNLMSEKMVYGAPIFSSGAMDNTMATRQMSAFRLSEKLISYNRQGYWLRDVVSSTYFAVYNGIGSAHTYPASALWSVRPFALLR